MRSSRIYLGLAGVVLALAACSDSGPTTHAGVTALAEIIPAPGSTGIDPAAPMVMRFSGAMGSGMEQYVDVHQGDIAGPIVPMRSWTWSTDRSRLTCTPGEPLQSHTRYVIHMGSGMTDASGHMADTEQHGTQMGGQPVTAAMMGPMHDGRSATTMGPGWQDPGDGHVGMAFTFETQ
jgi:hypothetical protein